MISHAQNFQKATRAVYAAAMFDVDGTLTEMGRQEIPQPLKRALAQASAKVPMAICSGRKFDGILSRLEEILQQGEDPKALRAQWTLFVENGAIGVKYNPASEEYERFYEYLWPEKELSQEKVYRLLEKVTPAVKPSEIRKNECNVGVYPIHRAHYTPEKLAQITARLAAAVKEALSPQKGSDYFHVIDSGVAVHVMAKFPDKDFAIQQYAQFLREEKKLPIGPEAREILVVGDQPGPGFNDEKFLAGEWGTPFTAGFHSVNGPWPIPIVDEKGGRLNGPSATLHLIHQIFLVQSPPHPLS